jgi:subtilisin family serine protease
MQLHSILELKQGRFRVNLESPHDVCNPVGNNAQHPRAWWSTPLRFQPVETADFIGSVEAGAPVNFRDVFINPHGHGTHTLGTIVGLKNDIGTHGVAYDAKAIVIKIGSTSSVNTNNIEFT